MRHDYEGCKIQKYLGQTVEWCFCRGDDDVTPCNSQSRQSMGGGMLEYLSDAMHEEYEDEFGGYPQKYTGSLQVYESDAKQFSYDSDLFDSEMRKSIYRNSRGIMDKY